MMLGNYFYSILISFIFGSAIGIVVYVIFKSRYNELLSDYTDLYNLVKSYLDIPDVSAERRALHYFLTTGDIQDVYILRGAPHGIVGLKFKKGDGIIKLYITDRPDSITRLSKNIRLEIEKID